MKEKRCYRFRREVIIGRARPWGRQEGVRFCAQVDRSPLVLLAFWFKFELNHHIFSHGPYSEWCF